MHHKEYSQRGAVDKLGITPGAVVIIAESAWPIAADLREQILDRALFNRTRWGSGQCRAYYS